MNRLSSEKARVIAAEYILNGNDKVAALLKSGYSTSYAKGSNGKKVFQNVLVCAEIERMQAKTELETDITVNKVLTDLENTRLLAIAKADYSTAKECSVWQGKHLAMFVDSVQTTDLTKQADLLKMADDEFAERRRYTSIRLKEQTKTG